MKNSSAEFVIEAGHSERYWRDLYSYRGLLFFLAWRDIIVRYKQTVIGVAWAILPSLLMSGALALVFGRFAHLPSHGVPYFLLVLVGTWPWNLVSSAISQGGQSLVANSQLITKIYFPRLVIPLGATLVSLLDFGISGAVLVAFFVISGLRPTVHLLVLPLFFLMAFVTAMAATLWLSALNVRYRDVRYVIPFLIQFGLFISPVGFSSDRIPDHWRWAYSLNPMVGIIEGFRWSILSSSFSVHWPQLWMSAGVVLVLFISGLAYFRHVERVFADVI